MIESLYTNTCDIQRRTSASDGWNEQQDTIIHTDVACLFINKTGVISGDDRFERVEIDGTLHITEEILVHDEIILEDGFIYDIIENGIKYHKDIMTGLITHYEIMLVRRSSQNETEITIAESP